MAVSSMPQRRTPAVEQRGIRPNHARRTHSGRRPHKLSVSAFRVRPRQHERGEASAGRIFRERAIDGGSGIRPRPCRLLGRERMYARASAANIPPARCHAPRLSTTIASVSVLAAGNRRNRRWLNSAGRQSPLYRTLRRREPKQGASLRLMSWATWSALSSSNRRSFSYRSPSRLRLRSDLPAALDRALRSTRGRPGRANGRKVVLG